MIMRRIVRAITSAFAAVILVLAAFVNPASAAPQPVRIINHLLNGLYCLDSAASPDFCNVSAKWLFVAREPAKNSWWIVAFDRSNDTCLEQYPSGSAHLRVVRCNWGKAQSWIPQRQDDPPGAYNRLINEESWQCLDMSHGYIPNYPHLVATAVTAWPCAPGLEKKNQLWSWS